MSGWIFLTPENEKCLISINWRAKVRADPAIIRGDQQAIARSGGRNGRREGLLRWDGKRDELPEKIFTGIFPLHIFMRKILRAPQDLLPDY